MVYLWRAVDAEGEVLDVLVQSKRNKHAALKLMRKLLRKYAVVPERLVTDDLRSYGAATLELGIDHLHDRGDGVGRVAAGRHGREPDAAPASGPCTGDQVASRQTVARGSLGIYSAARNGAIDRRGHCEAAGARL